MTKRLLLLAAVTLLLGAGCIQISGSSGSTGSGNDGGLWKSVDSGTHWSQKSAIAAVGTPKSFASANLTRMAFDPSDAHALYVGTDTNGIYFSYASGESWMHADALGAVPVSGVAVHPTDKCVIYVSTGNRIVRTKDCSRTWDAIYVDTRAQVQVSDVVADFFNPTVVYAATTAGDVLKSTDGGDSWAAITRITRIGSSVTQLVMSKADSRILWAVTKGKGLWKSSDAGATWTDLSPKFNSFSNALNGVILAEDRATPNAWVAASNYGLLRTTDGGDSWKSIPLLTPSGAAAIFSLVVDPKNSNQLWYGTANTLYHSVNGGARWVTTRLPTSRMATSLLVDPSNNSATLYMGTAVPQKKQGF